MTIRRDLGERLPNQGHYFNAGTLYKRFTPAGPDHAQVAAAAGMADYVDDLYTHHFQRSTSKAGADGRARAVHDLMRAHETALLQPLLDYLTTKNAVRVLGPRDAAARMPTVAIALDEPGEAAAARLAEYGVMCGGGDFYAVRCLAAQGINPDKGVLRVSFVHYASREEVARLIDALEAAL
jgi:selenocysteine lyase/cysteine desulfurase